MIMMMMMMVMMMILVMMMVVVVVNEDGCGCGGNGYGNGDVAPPYQELLASSIHGRLSEKNADSHLNARKTCSSHRVELIFIPQRISEEALHDWHILVLSFSDADGS